MALVADPGKGQPSVIKLLHRSRTADVPLVEAANDVHVRPSRGRHRQQPISTHDVRWDPKRLIAAPERSGR